MKCALLCILLLCKVLDAQGQNYCIQDNFPYLIKYNSNIVTHDSIDGNQLKGNFLFCGRIAESLQLLDCEIIRFRLQTNDTIVDYTLSDYRNRTMNPYMNKMHFYMDLVVNKMIIDIAPESHYVPFCKICLFVTINEGSEESVKEYP